MSRYTQDEWIDPVDFRIGNTIRMLRIVRGLSQQALARRLNVTFQQVQKYEKAKTHIAASRLYEIARVLDTPVEAFFDSPETDQSAQAAIRELVDRYDTLSPQFGYHEFVELNRAFVAIADPAVRKSVLNLINGVAGDWPQREGVRPPEGRQRAFRPPAGREAVSEDRPSGTRPQPGATESAQPNHTTEVEPA